MSFLYELLDIQAVEHVKEMKSGKSDEYCRGFDDACKFITDYLQETRKISQGLVEQEKTCE